ncbi:MAG: acylphosphatase [Candidatus Eisenbacteria bacterium]|nr:acylphosphatase [Candidatus Eisenbacteria bacterium]
MQRLHVILRGRVQGVGFRHFVWKRATELALDGEVRNLADGAVEIVASGDAVALGRLLEMVRCGPSSARVVNVDAHYDSLSAPGPGFHVVE